LSNNGELKIHDLRSSPPKLLFSLDLRSSFQDEQCTSIRFDKNNPETLLLFSRTKLLLVTKLNLQLIPYSRHITDSGFLPNFTIYIQSPDNSFKILNTTIECTPFYDNYELYPYNIHLLAISTNEIKLFKILPNDIKEVIKKSFNISNDIYKRVIHLDSDYGLLYIISPSTGQLLIYHIEDDSIELAHESFVEVKGLVTSVFGEVEHSDVKGTMISLEVVDIEGVKAGGIFIPKLFILTKTSHAVSNDLFETPMEEDKGMVLKNEDLKDTHIEEMEELRKSDSINNGVKSNKDSPLGAVTMEMIRKTVRSTLMEIMPGEIANTLYPFFKHQRQVAHTTTHRLLLIPCTKT